MGSRRRRPEAGDRVSERRRELDGRRELATRDVHGRERGPRCRVELAHDVGEERHRPVEPPDQVLARRDPGGAGEGRVRQPTCHLRLEAVDFGSSAQMRAPPAQCRRRLVARLQVVVQNLPAFLGRQLGDVDDHLPLT